MNEYIAKSILKDTSNLTCFSGKFQLHWQSINIDLNASQILSGETDKNTGVEPSKRSCLKATLLIPGSSSFSLHGSLTVFSLVHSSFKIAVGMVRFRGFWSSSQETDKEKNLPAAACNISEFNLLKWWFKVDYSTLLLWGNWFSI